MKINIGCGGNWAVDGWTGVDNSVTAFLWQSGGQPSFVDFDVRRGLPFADAVADVVFSSHTLEHFTYYEGIFLLYEIWRVLKPGAPLCLVVPDMDIYIARYLARDASFLCDAPVIGGVPRDNLADNLLMNFYSDPRFNQTCHRYAFNLENISASLRTVGFDGIERRAFHDFSYWPELKRAEFRSPLPRIADFSLCVQARKVEVRPDPRETNTYREAVRYSCAGADLRAIEMELAATKLREDAKAERYQSELDALRGAADAAVAEWDAREKALTEKLDNATTALAAAERSAGGHSKEHHHTFDELTSHVDGLTRQMDELTREIAALRTSAVRRLLRHLRRVLESVSAGRSAMRIVDRLRRAISSSDPSERLPAMARRAAQRLLRRSALTARWLTPTPEERLLQRCFSVPRDAATPQPERYSPLISIIMPTFNTPVTYLREAIDSVLAQSYGNWQLIIIDDASTSLDCLRLLESPTPSTDSRITVNFLPENVGIAQASQAGLDRSDGEFVVFLDHDDILAPRALSVFVEHLRARPEIDMLYSDHAMLSSDGKRLLSVALKPGWAPEFVLSTSYIIHLKLIRRSAAIAVDGFAQTLHLSQDYGLTLKLLAAGARVEHVPDVLYFWRIHGASVTSGAGAKPGIIETGRRSIEMYLEAKAVAATVICPEEFSSRGISVYKLVFAPPAENAVTVVVPFLSWVTDVSSCLSRIRRSLGGSTARVLGVGLRSCIEPNAGDADVLLVDSPAEVSGLLADICGEILVFVDPRTQRLSNDWLSEMVGYFSVSPEIGAVGGKVIDAHGCVVGGGMLFLPGLPFIGEGHSADDGVYWFNGRIASNVEAVSASFFATRRDLYSAVQGHDLGLGAREAGACYALALRGLGKRIVYNPWAEVHLSTAGEAVTAPREVEMPFDRPNGEIIDRYYNYWFSHDRLYEIDPSKVSAA